MKDVINVRDRLKCYYLTIKIWNGTFSMINFTWRHWQMPKLATAFLPVAHVTPLHGSKRECVKWANIWISMILIILGCTWIVLLDNINLLVVVVAAVVVVVVGSRMSHNDRENISRTKLNSIWIDIKS